MGELFREGGPHRIRRTGPDECHMSVTLPVDEAGMLGRECPSDTCSPGYFKVKPGTGVTGQTVAYCPYCRSAGDPEEFHTEAQREFARDVAVNEAIGGVNDMIRGALGLDAAGKKKIGGGLISIEMSLQPTQPSYISRPIEQELRRDLLCSTCGLQHAVFGLAVWCPDCGADLFLSHVGEEFSVIRRILAAVSDRNTQLGPRVAARDVENALEDVVSLFETVLKVMCRLYLRSQGMPEEEITTTIETKVRNKFQSIALADATFAALLGRPLLGGESASTIAALTEIFEKRHPITHNLGIVDRKYIRKVASGELVGREVRVSASEVIAAIEVVERVLAGAYRPSAA